MGCQVGMSGEIRDWLHELCRRDPGEARLAGEALAALAAEGPGLGPPLIVPIGELPPQPDPREALDDYYQERLERMTATRRYLAEAETVARDIQQRIGELEAAPGPVPEPAGRELAGLRERLPRVLAAQRELQQRQQRGQADLEAFRSRKETLKARYTAAEAEQAVQEIIAASGEPVAEDAAAAAAAKRRQITAELARELRGSPGAVMAGDGRLEPGLLELRPGTPGPGGIRIIFALQPPGTALLLAVLEDDDAVQDRYAEAAAAASGLLRQARAGQAPDAAEHTFAGGAPLLREFFPDSAAEVDAGAAALAARIRGGTLAGRRIRLGLTQAEVAARMGVSPDRVAAIEHGESGATEIRTLASYVEALGGWLEITAEIAGERTVLR